MEAMSDEVELDVSDKDFFSFYLGFSEAPNSYAGESISLINPASSLLSVSPIMFQCEDSNVIASSKEGEEGNGGELNENSFKSNQTDYISPDSKDASQLQSQFLSLLKYQKQLEERQLVSSVIAKEKSLESQLDEKLLTNNLSSNSFISSDTLKSASIAAYQAAIRAGATMDSAKEVAEQALHIALARQATGLGLTASMHLTQTNMPFLVSQSNGSTPTLRSPSNLSYSSLNCSDPDMTPYHFWNDVPVSNKRQRIDKHKQSSLPERSIDDYYVNRQDQLRHNDNYGLSQNSISSASNIVFNSETALRPSSTPVIFNANESQMKQQTSQGNQPIHNTDKYEYPPSLTSISRNHIIKDNGNEGQNPTNLLQQQFMFVPLSSVVKLDYHGKNSHSLIHKSNSEVSPKSESQFHISQSPVSKLPTAEIRMRNACDSCTKLKVKCFGKESGVCYNCSKYGHNCIFTPQRKRGPPAKNKFKILGLQETNNAVITENNKIEKISL